MLQFITNKTEKYDILESAKIALEGGCKWIQLRMKNSLQSEIFRTGFELQQLCYQYGATLIIDDEVEICKDLNCDGVHLGKEDMDPLKARAILGETKVIGGTANTYEDIVNLVEKGVDYIGLGPFRFTTTKEKLSPILGIEGYRNILDKCKENNIKTPIVAIGGITNYDIPYLLETGITGIAISSTILNAVDPVAQTKDIMSLFNMNTN